MSVKFRPTIKRATNLYLPVESATTRDTVLPSSTTSLSAFSDYQAHDPEKEFSVFTNPSKDAKWLGTPHMVTAALLSSVSTSDYSIPRTLMFHIQYPENLTAALAYDLVYGDL